MESGKYALFENAVRSCPMAIVIIDSNSVILEWNTAAEKIFKWPRDQIISKTLMDTLLPPVYTHRHMQGMQRFLNTGTTHVQGKDLRLEALDKDGTTVSITLNINHVPVNKDMYFIGFITEITFEPSTGTFEKNSDYTFLVVEDNIISGLLLCKLLTNKGYKVHSVENGQDAVSEALAKQPSQYSLILADIHMPVLDGLEMSRILRERGYSGPIIAVTSDPRLKQECIENGMNDFILKPYSIEELMRVIDKWKYVFGVPFSRPTAE